MNDNNVDDGVVEWDHKFSEEMKRERERERERESDYVCVRNEEFKSKYLFAYIYKYICVYD